jgi:toxin ParE1/3/4
MRIRWSPEAADDLERIVRRIEKDSVSAAAEVAGAIFERVDSLKDSPERGRLGRIRGSRELVFAPLSYIVVYRVKGQIVEVSRIFHGAQDWP